MTAELQLWLFAVSYTHLDVYKRQVTTDAKMEMPVRLQHLYTQLTAIIEQYQPEEAAIEELFFNNNAKTAIMVGQARGVAVLACVNGGLEISEYTPLQIKRALVGYGLSLIHI